MELIEILEALNETHGPSGDEGGVRAKIEELARPFADEITTDALGNLIVHKKGEGPRLMFTAHMDSIGFIVTHIEKEGFLRVGKLGGVVPREAAYTSVRFKNGLRGVFVPEEKADFGKLKLDECFIDIGAKDGEEARKLVQVGDTAVYGAPLRVQQPLCPNAAWTGRPTCRTSGSGAIGPGKRRRRLAPSAGSLKTVNRRPSPS